MRDNIRKRTRIACQAREPVCSSGVEMPSTGWTGTWYDVAEAAFGRCHAAIAWTGLLARPRIQRSSASRSSPAGSDLGDAPGDRDRQGHRVRAPTSAPVHLGGEPVVAGLSAPCRARRALGGSASPRVHRPAGSSSSDTSTSRRCPRSSTDSPVLLAGAGDAPGRGPSRFQLGAQRDQGRVAARRRPCRICSSPWWGRRARVLGTVFALNSSCLSVPRGTRSWAPRPPGGDRPAGQPP